LAYATQDDLVPLRMTEQELVELTDDSETDEDPGAGEVNVTIVGGALTEASARIDSYCRQRYITPLQQSDTIKGLTLDIAQYLLFTRRRTTKPNETVAERYLDAINFLKDIASGKASLDQPVGATQPQRSSGETLVTSKRQTFDDDNLCGWSH
jgi:phage gp36-like protein